MSYKIIEHGMDRYTLLYFKKMSNKDSLDSKILHMEHCSMLCGSLDGRGDWERMDACICMAESFCCSPETITTLFINR